MIELWCFTSNIAWLHLQKSKLNTCLKSGQRSNSVHLLAEITRFSDNIGYCNSSQSFLGPLMSTRYGTNSAAMVGYNVRRVVRLLNASSRYHMKKSKFLSDVTARGYRLVTGRAPTVTSAHISDSFVRLTLKLALAKFLTIASTILAGNCLGTRLYGQLALILAIGTFWCLPFFTCWGLAYVKFTSESDCELAAERKLNATLMIVFLVTGLLLPGLLVFRKPLAVFVRVTPEIWTWGCIFGVLMGGYYLSKNIFQARQDWSSYAVSELLFTGSLIAGVLVLFLLRPTNAFNFMVAVFASAHLFGMLFAFRNMLRTLRLPRLEDLSKVASYGTGLMISFGLSLLAMQLDKLFLNYYADSGDVGRYQAYYISTFGLLNSLSIILNNYLLPLYGKHSKRTIQNILARFLLITSLPLWILCLLFGRIAFMLFGKSFHFEWIELLWASTFSVAIFSLQVIVFFSMTLGRRALIYNTVAYAIMIVLELLLLPILIRSHGVTGAFQAMAAANAVGFGVIFATVNMPLQERQA
jgi:O-antigen/teichoic acid export membrane protein